MSISLSVVVCTHNPRKDYLERTLAALRDQTLSNDRWELLLIDNASKEDLSKTVDLSWHPNGKHFREEQLGLTPARIRGIVESASNLVVFVDDDNLLQSDYLELTESISESHPHLGAWSGQVVPVFDETPASWTKPYWKCLTVRSLLEDGWSFSDMGNPNTPYGAGLCVRRVVAESYVGLCRLDPVRKNLDRKGDSLMSAGDVDMALHSCDKGLGTGLFRRLMVKHLIPPKRLTPEYLLKIEESLSLSGVILGKIRGWPISHSSKSFSRRLIDWLRSRKKSQFAKNYELATEKGRVRGIEFDVSPPSPDLSETTAENINAVSVQYLLSDRFDYTKLVSPDAGPEYAKNLGWSSVGIQNSATLPSGTICVVDPRISEEECEALRNTVRKQSDLNWVFKIIDPYHEHNQNHHYYNLLFSLCGNSNVAFISPYQPAELTRRLQKTAGDRKFLVLPYSYRSTREVTSAGPRKNLIAVTGRMDQRLYPFRQAIYEASKKSSYKRRTSILNHPGYADIGHQTTHSITGDRFVNHLAMHRFMLLCPSRCFLEFLKYGECAYAGCVPVGIAPNGLPAAAREAVVQLQLDTLDKSIDAVLSMSDSEATDRATKYRESYRRERNPALLNRVFSQFCGQAFS